MGAALVGDHKNKGVCLELRGVSLRFGAETVLRDVNVKVHKGERIAIIGPSGAGKSLTLKLLAGLIVPTEGSLFVEGLSFHGLSSAEQQSLRLKMGMLFQKNALFDSLSNAENIAFPLREVRNLSDEAIDVIVDRFLGAVGIAHAKLLFPDEISGGMQKRLGIARALALDPEIVLYDDPTAGLDPITSRNIIDLIVELQRARSSTVVAITNDMNRAFQLAERILIVIRGELFETGSPEQTRNHPDPRVRQFVQGLAQGPLTGAP